MFTGETATANLLTIINARNEQEKSHEFLIFFRTFMNRQTTMDEAGYAEIQSLCVTRLIHC